MQLVKKHETSWQASEAKVVMNIRLDARVVPSPANGARIAYSHLVVVDDLVTEVDRAQLLDFITAAGHDHSHGPPTDKWEKETCDAAGGSRTWGLKHSVLQSLASSELPAMLEIHARLSKLYPDYDIAHMPSEILQHQAAVQAKPDEQHAVDCDKFVANAAVHGDNFDWHIDADPAGLPQSPWTDRYGDYCNGEPGRPLFVSLILYLNADWPREWLAETLFLDSNTDTGVMVRPKPGRGVLMDQDVIHRLSAPSMAAGQPRYSLVWKLVFVPKHPAQCCTIARADWGQPTAFGSAAKLARVMRQLKRAHDSSNDG